jgi:predicted secreted hydrolase
MGGKRPATPGAGAYNKLHPADIGRRIAEILLETVTMPTFARALILVLLGLMTAACARSRAPVAVIRLPEAETALAPAGFQTADGLRRLVFPDDFGAHPDFRTEWWYYTGNLETAQGRHFGFELTFFRVGLLPPTVARPTASAWYNHSLYFAHFAVSDIAGNRFHAFERYARPGPGLAGAQASPYRVWLEDWSVVETTPGHYRLSAAEGEIGLTLILTDTVGVILHGENGYSRKGTNPTNASYYYSQPRLQAGGVVHLAGRDWAVRGLVWKDHEFSTALLDENQVGWDWFALHFDDGAGLMLFQLRERGGTISPSAAGTFIAADGATRTLSHTDFAITVLDTWRSPRSGGVYPSRWQVSLPVLACRLELEPWMADQELHFRVVTYWEGAVRFRGTCRGETVRGNGYVELTGYAPGRSLPLF